MGLISVYSKAEEQLLFKLLREFASKVCYGRNAQKTEMSRKYERDLNVFGVVDVLVAEDQSEAIYEVSLPDHYLKFFIHILDQNRTPQ